MRRDWVMVGLEKGPVGEQVFFYKSKSNDVPISRN